VPSTWASTGLTRRSLPILAPRNPLPLTDLEFCTAEYGAHGIIRPIPSPNSNTGTPPSASFRIFRPALPNDIALSESAFEDKSAVENLIQ
ncbi:hypothetical protein H4R33_007146, partial [Dimargaris cristalligena]